MYYELFLDVLFLENLLMDYLMLRLVNRLLHGTATLLRSFGGALFGAGIYVLWVWQGGGTINTPLVYVVIITGMLKLGLGIHAPGRFLQGLLCLHAVLAAGYGSFAILQSFCGVHTLRTFFLYGTLSYLLFTTGIRLYQYLKRRTEGIYEVFLFAQGRCKKIKGLYDTGNLLTDTVTQKPVSVVQREALEGLFPKELLKGLDTWADLETEEVQEQLLQLNPRYIQFRSVGCRQGLLPVITLDALWIEGKDTRQVVVRPVIALSQEKCSDTGTYQMILNAKLIDS